VVVLRIDEYETRLSARELRDSLDGVHGFVASEADLTLVNITSRKRRLERHEEISELRSGTK